MVYQVVYDLIRDQHRVMKSHKYHFGTKILVGTYRDWRDAAVSYWRVRQGMDVNKLCYSKVDTSQRTESVGREQQLGMMNEADVANHVEWMKRCVIDTDFYLNMMDFNKAVWLRYESYVHDFDYMFDKLSEFFDMEIPYSRRELLVTKYSMDSNRERAEKLRDFLEYDPVHKIHGNHVLDGAVGGWQRFVPAELQPMMTEGLAEELQRYGY